MKYDWNNTYLLDNIDFLSDLYEDGVRFDLVLTDPPYNIGKDFGNLSDSSKHDAYVEFIDKRADICSKLLKPSGSLIWFCSYRHVGDIQYVLRNHLSQRRLMIWRYENGARRQKNEPVSEYEPFWWFSRSEEFTYNIDDLRLPYKKDYNKVKAYYTNKKTGEKKRWVPHPMGRKRGDVWDMPALTGKSFEKERTKHPTQKPIRLFTDIIKGFCPRISGKINATVIDPFAGSGTLGASCEHLNNLGNNIRWLGCDIEAKWVELSNKRAEDIRSKGRHEIDFGKMENINE